MTTKELLSKLDITVWNTVFTIVFFGGMVLTIFEIDIYRLTFIPVAIPIFIWVATGLLITPFNAEALAKEMKARSIFLRVFFNIVAWGGIATYVFMALNFYFRTNVSNNVALPILNNGYLAKGRNGCGNPYAEIDYKNFQKQIVFPCDTAIARYNTIILKIEKGLFGFDVIQNQKLTKE